MDIHFYRKIGKRANEIDSELVSVTIAIVDYTDCDLVHYTNWLPVVLVDHFVADVIVRSNNAVILIQRSC